MEPCRSDPGFDVGLHIASAVRPMGRAWVGQRSLSRAFEKGGIPVPVKLRRLTSFLWEVRPGGGAERLSGTYAFRPPYFSPGDVRLGPALPRPPSHPPEPRKDQAIP